MYHIHQLLICLFICFTSRNGKAVCCSGYRWNKTIGRCDSMFVCFGIFVPFENFSHIWRSHHCRWKVANFDLCSAFMAIEQGGFFNVPHLLWHGTFVYSGHFRGPVTLTPFAKRLAVKLSILVFTTYRSVAAGIRNLTFRMRYECSNRLRRGETVCNNEKITIYWHETPQTYSVKTYVYTL